MCTPLYTYLRRLQTGAAVPAVPSVVILPNDTRLTYNAPNTVILIPAFSAFQNAIVNVASLGVPLKPADYYFDKNTGSITIYNFQLLNGDAVYLIPAN